MAELDVLHRWTEYGGTWTLLSRLPDRAVLSLRRCDGGEQVEELVLTSAEALAWLDAQPG